MNKKKIFILFLFIIGVICLPFMKTMAQQQDVPEPVFMNFFIQPLYVPAYHGRDPFKTLDNQDRAPQISIAELDYHGVILLEDTPIALFTWRGNSTIQYTLKTRKLYSGDERTIDGVVGDINDSEVVLTQGDQKVTYPRK